MPAEKTKDKIDYKVLDVPRIAYEFAASATKGSRRLQPSAITEFQYMTSEGVHRGEWSTDPVSGLPLHVSGRSLQEFFELTVSTRDHWWFPEAVSSSEEEVAAIWAANNRTLEAQRYRALEALPGVSAVGALAMWNEERQKFQSAGNDGKRTETKTDATALSTNPWSIRFNADIAARDKKIAALLAMPGGGTRFCNDLAKAAGTTVGKPLGGTKHA